MDSIKITELFQSGCLRRVTWDVTANKYARLVLPSILDMDSLTLVDNEYATPETFGAFMRLLATTQSLRYLRIEQEDLNPLLPELAATSWRWKENLTQLELVSTRNAIYGNAAQSLREIVKIPQQLLVISFSTQQQDFTQIFQALRQGLTDLQRISPQIHFRKVTMPSHEQLYKNFAIPARQSNVLTALQLHPFSYIAEHRYTDCRVDALFFAAIIILLQATRLAELEITHIEASLQFRQQNQTALFDKFKKALEQNRTLQRLALWSTRGLQELWKQSIFPALVTNRSLQRLEFAHVHTTAVTKSFLELLPQMTGLRYVQAPGRQTFGRLWLDRLHTLPAPQDLTVEFSLGAFSSTTFKEFTLVEQILRRNRLWLQSQYLLSKEKKAENILTAMEAFGQDDEGLSAIFGVLRGSLWLF